MKKFKQIIFDKTFDEERALYGTHSVLISNCRFEGPADGESAFKESSDITAEKCCFNLRYPFWHDNAVSIKDCEMAETCRAALWYTEDVMVSDTKMHGTKAVRECKNVTIASSDIISQEFGWFTNDITLKDTTASGEYFLLRSASVKLCNVELKGKYSLQYMENAVIENCRFDTKDSLWHAKNVTVRDSVIKGEYLAWYCENVTFENCVISGTQPFCYCKGLKLINCEMHDADLAFEKSEVDAVITTPVISIKNPSSGFISVPEVVELIMTDSTAKCVIKAGK